MRNIQSLSQLIVAKPFSNKSFVIRLTVTFLLSFVGSLLLDFFSVRVRANIPSFYGPAPAGAVRVVWACFILMVIYVIIAQFFWVAIFIRKLRSIRFPVYPIIFFMIPTEIATAIYLQLFYFTIDFRYQDSIGTAVVIGSFLLVSLVSLLAWALFAAKLILVSYENPLGSNANKHPLNLP